MAKIKREELSGKFLEAFDNIVKLKNSKDAKQREAGIKGEKALEKLLSNEKGKAVKKDVKPKAKTKPKAKPKAKSKKKPKSKAKTSTSKTPKKLPFSTRASNLMKKEGLSWADAKAKLSKQIQDEKDKVEKQIKADKKEALNELEKLTKAPEFQKALSQYPKKGGGKKRAIKTTLSNDGKRQALPRGKRKSKNGKTYYEYRDNRSDVNSLPAPKGQYRYKGNTPPYLADGGAIDSLKRDMNSKLDIHSDYYAKGGLIPNVGKVDDFMLKELLMKNKKVLAILSDKEIAFMKRDNVDVIAVSGKNYDFIFTDGKKEFEIINQDRKLKHSLRDARPEIVEFYSKKFAKGGRTISIVNDGVEFDKSKYKAIYGDFDNDGTVNIDDANPLDKTKSGQVEQVELRKTFDKLLGVKAELDEIMYDAVETLDEKAPEGADIYARTKTPYSILKKLVEKRMLDPKRGLTDMIGTTIAVDNQKELEQVRDKIDGGLLGKVLDRDDFYKTPNAGYRAYHYIVEYKGVPVEVQLKTKNMKKLHEVSHESYKKGTLDAKSLDSISKLFMRADKGDAKAKAEISKLLKDKKLLASKVSKNSMAKGGNLDSHGLQEGDVILGTIDGNIQKIKDKKGTIKYVNLADGERSLDVPLPFEDGGEIDLFEDYEKQPKELAEIVEMYEERYADGDMDYESTKEFLDKVNAIGYTFDSGLDNEPYNLRPMMAKGGRTKHSLMQDRRRVSSESWEVAYQKRKAKMEAGGTLPTPFGQAGLVGETGTMNEMDLFAMGGGLPQGVHQYYGQTYNPAYPTPHGYAKGGDIKNGDVVNVKEPNYGYNADYYVVDDKAGYDEDGYLLSDTRKRESTVFEKEHLEKLYAKGGLTDSKYIPSYEIYEVVTKDGKVYENDYSAMEFLSGAYVSDKVVSKSDEDKSQMSLFKKGGKLPKGAIYIKRRDIDFITVGEDEDDKEKVDGKNLFNGFWIDPKKQKMLIEEAKRDGRLKKSTKSKAKYKGGVDKEYYKYFKGYKANTTQYLLLDDSNGYLVTKYRNSDVDDSYDVYDEDFNFRGSANSISKGESGKQKIKLVKSDFTNAKSFKDLVVKKRIDFNSAMTMAKGGKTKSSGSKRRTPMSLAKEIRKEGEDWQQAVKRASAILKKEYENK